MRCWHQLRIRGRWQVCRHCGVQIEQCPCVSHERAPDSDCKLCDGSGWLSVVRSQAEMFREFLALFVSSRLSRARHQGHSGSFGQNGSSGGGGAIRNDQYPHSERPSAPGMPSMMKCHQHEPWNVAQ